MQGNRGQTRETSFESAGNGGCPLLLPNQTKRSGPSAYFGEKGWRFVRLWQTLLIVVEAEKPLSVPEINERLGLDSDLRQYAGNLTTTRDDLWVLVRCGFPIALLDETSEEIDLAQYLEPGASRRGKLRNTRWCLRSGGDIGRLHNPKHRRPTPAELTTLALLRALLREDVPEGYPLFDQLRVLLDELHVWLASHLRGADRSQMIEQFVRRGRRLARTRPETQVLMTVAEGLRRRQVLEGLYTLADGRERLLQVLPLAAWHSDGNAHLFGARGFDGKLRVYRLNRFESLRLVPSAHAPRVDEAEVERLFAGRFGGFVAEPQRVVLWADASVAYLFQEYEFHPSQRLKRRKGGALTVTLECAVSHALEEWVHGFGEHIEVREPASLREAIADRLRAAARKYGDR